MISVVKEFSFEAGHRVLGHQGKCQFLHGHSYRGEVEVSAEGVDELGMVIDFADLKRVLTPLIAAWDHVMVLDEVDPLVDILRDHGQQVVQLAGNATVESMALLLFQRLSADLEQSAFKHQHPGFAVESVTLWETPTCRAIVRRERA